MKQRAALEKGLYLLQLSLTFDSPKSLPTHSRVDQSYDGPRNNSALIIDLLINQQLI